MGVSDIWGFCDRCVRWVAYPHWFDRNVPECRCPVCHSEPRRIVNRSALPRPVNGRDRLAPQN